MTAQESAYPDLINAQTQFIEFGEQGVHGGGGVFNDVGQGLTQDLA